MIVAKVQKGNLPLKVQTDYMETEEKYSVATLLDPRYVWWCLVKAALLFGGVTRLVLWCHSVWW